MRKAIIVGIIMMLCLCVVLDARTTKAQKLQSNLQQWEQFRWSGIIQVSMSSFSLRKDFVLAKDPNSMRLDILDSGLMGLQAKPIAAFYLKDKILVDAPDVARLKNVDLNWFVPQGSVAKFVHFTDSLQAHTTEILASRKATTSNTTFDFDKKYRLVKIRSSEFGMLATIEYNHRNQPTKLKLKHADSQIVELQINNQSYKNIQIEPLQAPPAPPEPEDLKQNTPLDKLQLHLMELDGLNMSELLDSLGLRGISLRGLFDTLQIGQLKLKDFDLGTLNLGGLQLDLRKYQDLSLDSTLDSLHLSSVKVEEMLNDLNLEQLKVSELIQRLRETDTGQFSTSGDPNAPQAAEGDPGKGTIDLQNMLKGQNMQGLDLQKLLQNLNLNEADLQKMMQGLNQGEPNKEGTDNAELQKLLQGLDLSKLNLEGLDLGKFLKDMNLNEADLQKMLQNLDLSGLNLEGLGQQAE